MIILTDDQRAGGTVKPNVMPHTVKWFRERGTRFSSAYAPIPLCCPSRASLMTGQYAHNHGVHTNFQAELLDQRITIQRYLQEAGYRTAIFGKYLNHWTADPPYFDEWAISWRGYYDALFNVGGKLTTLTSYSTDFIANRSLRFLSRAEEDDGRPWFLYVAPYAPHLPATPEPAYENAQITGWKGNPAVFEEDLGDKPAFLHAEERLDFRWVQERRRRQLRSLMSVDDLVGALMRRLGALGERSNTLALFLSDNGLMWGEHGLNWKAVPYTPSSRIPMFMRWPQGKVPAGLSDDRLTAVIDVAPTVLQAAGLEAEHAVDGRSLLDGSWSRDWLLFEYRGGFDVPPWTSLRSPTEVYVEYYEDEGAEATFREYYDVAADPWQLVNLLGDADPTNDPSTASVAQLSAQLARDRRCSGTDGGNPCP
jgi:arylsulfatase A-like enzyme